MSIFDDVRVALRGVRSTPGFAALAIVTLALGIGTTSAMFSVVYGVLYRPLPFRAADRVVQVWRTSLDGRRGNMPAGVFFDLQREARSLSGVAASFGTAVGLGASGEPARVVGAVVTANYFDVLGARAALGRTLRADDRPGDALVVLGTPVWRQHFGSDPRIVGKPIDVDGTPATVVGVMPDEFDYPEGARVWRLADRAVPIAPLDVEGDPLTDRDLGYLDVVARLTDGVSSREADAELGALARSLDERYPTSDRGDGFAVTSALDALVGSSRPTLLVLFGAVALVLLIACANLGALLVARALGRGREFAVRAALGASRGRLARQLLIESLVLALAGGAAGLLVGTWMLEGLRALLPESMPRATAVRLDSVAVAFATGVSALVGLGFGAAPAWWSRQVAASEALRTGGRTTAAGPRHGRRALVAIQVAVAVTLAAGAGVMVKSLLALQRQDVGFTADGVITQQIALPQSQYDSAAQVRFFRAVTERLREDPRVAAATVVFPTPLVNNTAGATIRVDRPAPGTRDVQRHRVRLASVAPQYFSVLKTPFLAGRDFDTADLEPSARAVVVNRALADQLLGGGDVLGRRLTFGDDMSDAYEVVGVVADAVAVTLESDPEPVLYLPFSQFTLPFMRVMVRGHLSEAATRDALLTAVRRDAPRLALDPPEPLTAIVREAAEAPRFRARLAGAFAVAAVLLSALGLYGLMSLSVAGRSREMATRIALGASPHAMRRAVLGEGLGLTAAGLVAGLLSTIALGRVVDALLFRTSTTDPTVLAALAGVMLAVATAACYLPARRATRVDPMTALRAD